MKIILSFFLILSAMFSDNLEQSPYYPCQELGGGYKICPPPDGSIEGAQIVYDTKWVENADIKTFNALGDAYAKDKENVYYESEILTDADTHSFEYASDYYAKDSKHLFFSGKIVHDADAKTIEYIGDYYCKDQNHVYWQGRVIKGADRNSFTPIPMSNGYGKDSRNIFYDDIKLGSVDNNTFEVLNIHFAKDKNHVYCAGRILNHIDAATIEVYEDDSNYMRDKNKVYYIFEPIKGIDMNSYQYLGRGYVKDKNRVYHDGKVIAGADSETFQSSYSEYGDAKDKNGYYNYGMKIKAY